MIFNNYNNIYTLIIPDNVILQNDMPYMFYNRKSIRSVNIAKSVIDNATNMYRSFDNCQNLSSAPFSGNNVVNMYNAYRWCYNITGSPACGEKVVNMYSTYSSCRNLTGSPVCGNNVIDISKFPEVLKVSDEEIEFLYIHQLIHIYIYLDNILKYPDIL